MGGILLGWFGGGGMMGILGLGGGDVGLLGGLRVGEYGIVWGFF